MIIFLLFTWTIEKSTTQSYPNQKGTFHEERMAQTLINCTVHTYVLTYYILCWLNVDFCWMSIFVDIWFFIILAAMLIKASVSEWLLLNAKWAICHLYHGESKIFIVLSYWNNSPRVDMSLHSEQTSIWSFTLMLRA